MDGSRSPECYIHVRIHRPRSLSYLTLTCASSCGHSKLFVANSGLIDESTSMLHVSRLISTPSAGSLCARGTQSVQSRHDDVNLNG